MKWACINISIISLHTFTARSVYYRQRYWRNWKRQFYFLALNLWHDIQKFIGYRHSPVQPIKSESENYMNSNLTHISGRTSSTRVLGHRQQLTDVLQFAHRCQHIARDSQNSVVIQSFTRFRLAVTIAKSSNTEISCDQLLTDSL